MKRQKCDKLHELVNMKPPYPVDPPNAGGRYRCDRCRNLCKVNNVWQCNTCRFDVCNQCYAPSPERCNQGHALVNMEPPYQDGDYACYQCSNVRKVNNVWRCNTCWFDVCNQCYAPSTEFENPAQQQCQEMKVSSYNLLSSLGGVASGLLASTKCEQGHALTNTEPVQTKGFRCCYCDVLHLTGNSWHCSSCALDVCNRCYGTTSIWAGVARQDGKLHALCCSEVEKAWEQVRDNKKLFESDPELIPKEFALKNTAELKLAGFQPAGNTAEMWYSTVGSLNPAAWPTTGNLGTTCVRDATASQSAVLHTTFNRKEVLEWWVPDVLKASVDKYKELWKGYQSVVIEAWIPEAIIHKVEVSPPQQENTQVGFPFIVSNQVDVSDSTTEEILHRSGVKGDVDITVAVKLSDLGVSVWVSFVGSLDSVQAHEPATFPNAYLLRTTTVMTKWREGIEEPTERRKPRKCQVQGAAPPIRDAAEMMLAAEVTVDADDPEVTVDADEQWHHNSLCAFEKWKELLDVLHCSWLYTGWVAICNSSESQSIASGKLSNLSIFATKESGCTLISALHERAACQTCPSCLGRLKRVIAPPAAMPEEGSLAAMVDSKPINFTGCAQCKRRFPVALAWGCEQCHQTSVCGPCIQGALGVLGTKVRSRKACTSQTSSLPGGAVQELFRKADCEGSNSLLTALRQSAASIQPEEGGTSFRLVLHDAPEVLDVSVGITVSRKAAPRLPVELIAKAWSPTVEAYICVGKGRSLTLLDAKQFKAADVVALSYCYWSDPTPVERDYHMEAGGTIRVKMLQSTVDAIDRALTVATYVWTDMFDVTLSGYVKLPNFANKFKTMGRVYAEKRVWCDALSTGDEEYLTRLWCTQEYLYGTLHKPEGCNDIIYREIILRRGERGVDKKAESPQDLADTVAIFSKVVLHSRSNSDALDAIFGVPAAAGLCTMQHGHAEIKLDQGTVHACTPTEYKNHEHELMIAVIARRAKRKEPIIQQQHQAVGFNLPELHSLSLASLNSQPALTEEPQFDSVNSQNANPWSVWSIQGLWRGSWEDMMIMMLKECDTNVIADLSIIEAMFLIGQVLAGSDGRQIPNDAELRDAVAALSQNRVVPLYQTPREFHTCMQGSGAEGQPYLPNEWVEYGARSRQQPYYTTVLQGQPYLPNEWVEFRDKRGQPYYFNQRTGRKQWDLPRAPPPPPPRAPPPPPPRAPSPPLPPGWAQV